MDLHLLGSIHIWPFGISARITAVLPAISNHTTITKLLGCHSFSMAFKCGKPQLVKLVTQDKLLLHIIM